MSTGVPLKLIHEAKNNVVTIESRAGELYRGHLLETDDTMNCLLENCHHTSADGKTTFFDQVFIRGSQITFFVVPDMFKNAPMFTRVKNLARIKNESVLRAKARKVREQTIARRRPE